MHRLRTLTAPYTLCRAFFMVFSFGHAGPYLSSTTSSSFHFNYSHMDITNKRFVFFFSIEWSTKFVSLFAFGKSNLHTCNVCLNRLQISHNKFLLILIELFRVANASSSSCVGHKFGLERLELKFACNTPLLRFPRFFAISVRIQKHCHSLK